VRLQPVVIGTHQILVDLGSGFGYYADRLREHAGYLVGVDLFLPSLHVAKNKRVFDDLVRADILHLPLRLEKVSCITLFDVIEHLSKAEGRGLLASLQPSVFVSTPNSDLSNTQYARLVGNVREHHVSVWSTSDLEDLGYNASARDAPLWMRLLGNKGIVIAHRERLMAPAKIIQQ
jgi:predicted TPR repeat methyltransferase